VDRLRTPGRVDSPDSAAPVTMLELFFDLVFVFTVTQVTTTITDADSARDYVQAACLLCVIWWMYDGYCWLSNNVGPTSVSTRLPMLVAMTAFLLLAIAVPEAFGADALLFAVVYLVIVVVHAVSFLRSTMDGSARAMLAIAPVNFGAAACLFVAVLLPERYRWVAWLAAVLCFAGSMWSRRESGFSLRPEHFAERHRLLLIIALGESVIAVGVSAQGHVTEADSLLAVLLSMLLISLLWWVHFADEERSTEAIVEIERTDPDRMVRVGLFAFSIAYLVLVSGVILVASGLHAVVHDPWGPLGWRAAWTMGVGVGVYLFGNSLHLWLLELSPGWRFEVCAVLALATAFIGHGASASWQVAALSVLILAALVPIGRASAQEEAVTGL
jgi:low temperature requirement protein LtrA